MLPDGISPVSPAVVNVALGQDLAGINDLTPTMSEVSGRTCLIQACARRLSSPRGCLIYDPDYGYNLSELVDDDLAPGDVHAISPNIVQELLKDERVLACDVSLQYVGLDQVQQAMVGTVANPLPIPIGALVIAVSITDGLGPFKLTLSVTSVSVSILQVTPS